jgi:DNA-binding SARP family transcriptional activator/pimeloyl-ACP methyl ester carboxylesterase
VHSATIVYRDPADETSPSAPGKIGLVTEVSVRSLGGFQVSVDGVVVPAEAWRRRRAAELVQILALVPARRLHREQIIDALWPELPPEAGAANLHKAAHYARRALGSAAGIVLRSEHVALWPDAAVGVDALQFEEAAERALRSGDADTCATVAATYAGELLPDDRFAEWLIDRRERLRQLYLQLLRRAGLWERVVAQEPTDEVAHRALMRAYAEAGNRSAALEQFWSLRDALARIDLEPTSQSRVLYHEIARAPLVASPVRYARVGEASIAYQVVEGGSADLLMIPGWVSHLELDWEEPTWVRWCERMTSFARLVRFDKRGTGLSDRPAQIPSLTERTADALAVLDAVGLERAHVMGWSEGGPLAVLLAVEHPERVQSLVLYGTQACFRRGPDYPWGVTDEERESALADVERTWGELAFSRLFAPSGGDRFARSWAAYSRAAASPSGAAALSRANLTTDIRGLLHRVQVPTLVLSRRSDEIGPPKAARYMAERIQGARFVELEGEDHVMWVGDIETLCTEIERFVSAPVAASRA